jgi:glycosyltransferase involved in cell wall biosynthesis
MPGGDVKPAPSPFLKSSVMAEATIVITTKNRLEELRKAVASAVIQTARPEVLVMDDGSTDGTAEAIGCEFPEIQVQRSKESHGLIVQRNRGAHLAASRVIFSIDDDAVFSSPGVVEQTLREFDHARVGAVAIPFVNVNSNQVVHQKAPRPDGIYINYDFIGTAHAVRRDLFLGLGGYREILIHQGEEEDFCMRLMNAGYVTRCGNADPIHHFESPRRSWTRMDYFGARNKVLYAWHNVPFPSVIGHLGAATANALLRALRPNRFWTRFRGVMAAYGLVFTGNCDRQPITPQIYQLSRILRTRQAITLEEIEDLLPDDQFFP